MKTFYHSSISKRRLLLLKFLAFFGLESKWKVIYSHGIPTEDIERFKREVWIDDVKYLIPAMGATRIVLYEAPTYGSVADPARVESHLVIETRT